MSKKTLRVVKKGATETVRTGVVARTDEGVSQGETSISQPKAELYHDSRGKFRPGNPGGGRKPRVVERAYLEALSDEFSPAEVVRWIRRAVELAEEHKSPKMYLQASEAVLDRIMGKPVAKSVSMTGKWEDFMYHNKDADAGMIDGEIVEANDS